MEKVGAISKIVISGGFLLALPTSLAIAMIATVLQVWFQGHFHPDMVVGISAGMGIELVIVLIIQIALGSD